MHQLEWVNEIFINAKKFKVTIHTLSEYDPIDEFIKNINLFFRDTYDAEEEEIISLKRQIWKLRSSVCFSLVPFDHPDLMLGEQIFKISSMQEYMPAYKKRLSNICDITDFLIGSPFNPKQEKVRNLVESYKSDKKKIGLIISLTRGPTPGWTECTLKEIQKNINNCMFISSKKAFMNNIFSNVILPSGGNLCPFLSSLYDGYRTKNLDIVVYKKENVRKPIKKILPRGSKIFCEPIKKDEQDVENNSDSVHSLEEEKAQEKFWEHIRKLSVNSSDIKSIDRDGEFFVDSRLILLSNSKKVYLRDDLSVIEISDYIDGKKNISEVGKKFPKRPVKKLENGDLIVLRTSGSGEYLYEVATELMNKDKKQDLKEKALGWKPILKEALKDYGSEKIYNKLKEKGHSLSYHQYIWIWTTDYVIGPKSKSLFKDLIHILFEDNYFRDPANQSTYANDRWNEMRLIIKYHITAGHLIRKSLLSKLKRLIEDGIQIIDAYYFTLAETGAGQMAIFRVSDVDSQSLKVPYSKIGTLLEIEE